MRAIAALFGSSLFLLSCVADELSVSTSQLEESTDPTGIGFAAPSVVVAGGTTQLQVFLTPGTNPTSTTLDVHADLSAIGGISSQPFVEDDSAPFSYFFNVTVDPGTSAGTKALPVTFTDNEGRSGTTIITLDVLSLPSDPSGVGSADPASVLAGQTTRLEVEVTPGENPTSTSMIVVGDLSSIGGSADQVFADPGNGRFDFTATVASGTSPGSKLLPITILDAEGRQGTTLITLNVSSMPSAVAIAAPSTVNTGATTLLTVEVTPGASPTSTSILVSADLSSIGGSAAQAFADDGNNVFSFTATVATTTSGGDKIVPFTITDAEGRSATASVTLTVVCKRGKGIKCK